MIETAANRGHGSPSLVSLLNASLARLTRDARRLDGRSREIKWITDPMEKRFRKAEVCVGLEALKRRGDGIRAVFAARKESR